MRREWSSRVCGKWVPVLVHSSSNAGATVVTAEMNGFSKHRSARAPTQLADKVIDELSRRLSTANMSGVQASC